MHKSIQRHLDRQEKLRQLHEELALEAEDREAAEEDRQHNEGLRWPR